MNLQRNYILNQTVDLQIQGLHEAIFIVFEFLETGEKEHAKQHELALVLLEYFFSEEFPKLNPIIGYISLFNAQRENLLRATKELESVNTKAQLENFQETELFLLLYPALAEANKFLTEKYDALISELDIFEFDFDALFTKFHFQGKIIIVDTNIFSKMSGLIPKKYYQSGKFTVKNSFTILVCDQVSDERRSEKRDSGLFPQSLFTKMHSQFFHVDLDNSEMQELTNQWKRTTKAKSRMREVGEDAAILEFQQCADIKILAKTRRLALEKNLVYILSNDTEVQGVALNLPFKRLIQVVELRGGKIKLRRRSFLAQT